LENGIRTSQNYPEQLLYIYGTNQMSDFGDLSKLYWTEFKLEGNADRLTRLKLGHDGLDADGNNWFNKKLNGITLPKLPLLKEANFCNIGLSTATSLDFSASEKLENFRATGSSNITSVKFAKGVALNTLYLPSTVTALTLEQANLLTDLITNYRNPVKGDDGNLVATPGLYLEGFFSGDSKLSSIDFQGGALGYNSYTILRRLWERQSGNVSMSEVNWCPYTKLTEGDVYDASKKYYKDNGHYGFVEYDNKGLTFDEKQFNADIISGILYREDGFGGRTETGAFGPAVTGIDDSAITMLNALYTNTTFYADASGRNRPDISGIIYINNTTAIAEDDIVDLQSKYPNLNFFFANVTQAYSAKFVIFNPDDYSEKYVKWADGSTSPAVQKIQTYSDSTYFGNPFTLFKPEKTHYDFVGWSLDNRNPYDKDGNLLDSVITVSESGSWSNQKLIADKYDYTYYAIFEIHEYELRFHNDTGTQVDDIVKVPYGQMARIPNSVPYKDDSGLDLYGTYNFIGYSSSVGGEIIDVTKIEVSSNEDFFANFEEVEDVRTIVHTDWFTCTDEWTYEEGSLNSDYTQTGVTITPALKLRGKITIPRTFQGKPVMAIGGFRCDNLKQGEDPYRVTHIFMEKADDGSKAPLCVVVANAFRGMSTLKYFDFGSCNLRAIQSFGFNSCSLDADLIDLRLAPLQQVQNNAFNQGITSSKPTTLFIPASLKLVGNTGFANLRMFPGSNLEVGAEGELSDLNLEMGTTTSGYFKFTQNSYPFSKIYFYSKLYDSKLDIAFSSGSKEITVEQCFVDAYDTTAELEVI
jgi:hypothetical protein